MSTNRREYNDKDINRLLIQSGGRCMMCNRLILEDELTDSIVNLYERAHICAANDKGPRADVNLSESERNDVNNIMILCPTCHTKIDKPGQFEIYTVECLKEIKKQKIEKVSRCLDLLNNESHMIVKYVSSISCDVAPLTHQMMKRTCIDNNIFPDQYVCDISDVSNSENPDLTTMMLADSINKKLNRRIDEEPDKPICLFAIAPQYLLIYLGYMINTLSDVKVFTKHRESWHYKMGEAKTLFSIIRPSNINKRNKVAIKVSSTSQITDYRINDALGPNVDIWEIKANNIHFDNINSASELEFFRQKCSECMDMIYSTYGKDVDMNVFPAMCNSLAVQFGRAIFHKVFAKINIYDMNKENDIISDKLMFTIR